MLLEKQASSRKRLQALVLINLMLAGAAVARPGLAVAAAEKEDSLRDVLTIAGMNADAIAPRLPDAQGGPYIPMGVDAAKSDLFARDPNLDVADATDLLGHQGYAFFWCCVSAALTKPLNNG